jgi:hypothetical protein
MESLGLCVSLCVPTARQTGWPRNKCSHSVVTQLLQRENRYVRVYICLPLSYPPLLILLLLYHLLYRLLFLLFCFFFAYLCNYSLLHITVPFLLVIYCYRFLWILQFSRSFLASFFGVTFFVLRLIWVIVAVCNSHKVQWLSRDLTYSLV